MTNVKKSISHIILCRNDTSNSAKQSSFIVYLPLAGGTFAVWVYGLEVFGILLLFYLERSPRHQGRAKPLSEKKHDCQKHGF